MRPLSDLGKYAGIVRGPVAALLASRLLTAIALYGGLPFLALRLTVDVGWRPSWTALAVGVALGASRVLGLPVGVLADRVGPVRVLTVSGLLAGACMCWLGLQASTATSVVALIGYAVGTAAQYVAFNTAVPRFVPHDRLPIGFALMGVMLNVGVVVGPVLSVPFLADREFGSLLVLTGICQCAGTLPALVAQRLARNEKADAANADDEQSGPSRRSPLVSVLVLYGVTWGLLYQVLVNLAPYAERHLGDAGLAAAFFTIQAILALVVVPVSAKVMTGWGLRRTMRAYAFGTLLLPAALICFAAFPARRSIAAIALLIVAVTAWEAFTSPTVGTVVARTIPRERHGRAFGWLGVAQAIGIGAGSLFAAIALEVAGPESGRYPLSWVIIAVLFAVPSVLAAKLGLPRVLNTETD